MKHRFLYIGLAAIFALASCEQDDSLWKESPSGSSLQLGTVQVLTQMNNALTRTVGYTSLTEPDAQIGLFRKSDGSTYSKMENKLYQYKNSDGGTTYAWLPNKITDAIQLHPTTAADIAAYYPYNASPSMVADKEGVINLSAAIRNESAPQDLWYNHFQASGTDYQKNLSLGHAYCRMKITILKDGVADTKNLYSLKISGGRASTPSTTDGIFSTGTLDMFSGTYTGGTQDYTPINNISTDTYPITNDANTTKAVFDLMMIPTTLSDDVTMTVTVGESSDNTSTMSASIPADDFNGKLTAGNIYNLSARIKGSTITFSTTGEVPSLGTNIEELPFGIDKLPAYILPPVYLGAGLNVATGNLYYYESALIDPALNPNYDSVTGKNYWYSFASRTGEMWVEDGATAMNIFPVKGANDACSSMGDGWDPLPPSMMNKFNEWKRKHESYVENGITASGWWVSSNGSIDKSSAIFLQDGVYTDGSGSNIVFRVDDSGIAMDTSGSATEGFMRCYCKNKF